MPTGTLERIIEDLMFAADAAAASRTEIQSKFNIRTKGESAFIRLNHGLGIRIRKDGGAYILTIWRIGTMPAMREWNIVTAAFPYDTPVITPNTNISGKTHYMIGRIPAHPKVTGILQ